VTSSQSAADSVKTLSAECLACGQPVDPRPRGRGRKFCSSQCRARWHAGRREATLIELEATLARAAALVAALRGGPDFRE
jgi:endogenous inhibitor of DNA gyrase (YacG/DUF329 family)